MSEIARTPSGPQRFFLLFIPGLAFMALGAYPLAAMCFAVLSARHWLAGERQKSYGVAVLSGVTAAIVLASPGVGIGMGVSALLGCLIGNLVERRWSYGWRLVTVVGVTFPCVAVVVLLDWQTIRHDMTIFFNARIAELEAQANVNELLLEVFRWCDVNYAFIGLGSIFGSILLMTAYVLCVVDRWPSAAGTAPRRKTSGFQRMRLPDWLVWIAIAVALLWMVEHRWPNEALRAVTWNTAVALTCVYWLNGFSILLYALTVLQATLLATLLVVSGMILFGLYHLLGMVGLFDTWCDFRVRVRRLAMLRRLGYGPGNRDV